MPSTRTAHKATAFAVAGLVVLASVGWLGSLALDREAPLAPPVPPPAAAVPGPDAAPPATPDAGPPSGATLAGQVTADRAPVAGARVVLTRKDQVFRGATDAGGSFAIAGLPDDELTLDVFAVGFLPPAKKKVRPGVPVDVVLSRGATVSGRVVDLAGNPVAGAEIELSGEAGGRRLTISAAERARRQVFAEGTAAAPARARLLPVGELGVLVGKLPPIPPRPLEQSPTSAGAVVTAAEFATGADGAFRIPAVPRGRFTARARHPDFADGEAGPVDVDGEAAVTIRLARGAELAGRVTDTAGQPIFGATVAVREMKRTEGVGFSDRNGSYRIGHVAGQVTVRAAARGYAPVVRELLAEEGGRLQADFTLAATGEAAPEGVEEEATGSLRLDLRDGGTRGPLLAFQVTARGPRGAKVTREGEGGDLDLGPLAAGAWTLTVEARGYASQAFPATVVAGEATPLRLELTQGATIGGTVYSRHGEPVSGAEVTCGLARGRTSPTGAFRLTGVPAGEVAVRASHATEGRGELWVPLRNGDEALTLELRLE
jgi:hypothetical protein